MCGLQRGPSEVPNVSRFYSIDDRGVVTFCRPTEDEERALFATLKARAANLNAPGRSAGEPAAADDRREDAQA